MFGPAGALGAPGTVGGGGGWGTFPKPPGRKATMKPSGRPEMPTAVYTVLRAMLVPPHDATGLVPVDDPQGTYGCECWNPAACSECGAPDGACGCWI